MCMFAVAVTPGDHPGRMALGLNHVNLIEYDKEIWRGGLGACRNSGTTPNEGAGEIVVAREDGGPCTLR